MPRVGVWRVGWAQGGAFTLLLQEKGEGDASRKLGDGIKSPLPDQYETQVRKSLKADRR